MQRSSPKGPENTGFFPPVEVLKRLAISDTGFVFDPVSGQSFSAGETGVAVLKAAREETDSARLIDRLCSEYAATPVEIERDILDFGRALKEFLK